MAVELTTPAMLTATDLFIGANALYVNMASRQIYKLDIFGELLKKEIDDLNVIKHKFSEYMVFDIRENNGNEVARLCELEN